MKVKGTRFATIDYRNEDVITFSEGLVGFETCRRFVLISSRPESAFRWLQSLDEPALAFLVIDPAQYVQGYEPTVQEAVATSLELAEETPRMVLTTVSIPPGKPNDLTLNLAAPIVVNAATRQARQVVLEGEAYTMRHRVFPQGDRESQEAAA
ncbi:MAG: flagellar assembly protein FliW [Fimbriimonas ginsengisoli]|uniref:Flagellar assembly factor FliW n=1 Tax=Fimbriimonas ginsengisoli TaxID=1005039 RepID=A0A931LR17_FIMGI|nr:flagellar assembly protein FliW [Fimbriimonas ginsengisoli]